MLRKNILFGLLIIIGVHYSSAQNKLDPSELLVHTTIQVISKKIDPISKREVGITGTAFFFEFEHKGKYLPVIISNYHVIKEAKKGTIVFNLKNKNGETLIGKKREINFKNFNSLWIKHPDPTIDLAVLPVEDLLYEEENKGFPLSFVPFKQFMIPNDSIVNELMTLEDIFMIGYPFGLKDNYNNLPIVRKGITATPYSLDYENRTIFLADIPVFPGSSGSPIVLYNPFTTLKFGGITEDRKLLLLGINYATYNNNYEGVVVPKLTFDIKTKKTISVTPIPYNIGIIIKSRRILDFIPLLFKN